jgi:hypothetical protein
MHTDADLYIRFKEVFGVEPNPTKAEIMKQIGNPLARMHEMFDYIQHVTNSLRSTLKAETEKVQANTYLITSEQFEMAFNHHNLNKEG